MEQKYLTKTQVADLIKGAPPGVTPESIVKDLVEKRGYTLEGFTPTQNVPQTMGQNIKTGLESTLEKGMDKTDEILKARKAGEQGLVETGFQLAGRGALTVTNALFDVAKGFVESVIELSPEEKQAKESMIQTIAPKIAQGVENYEKLLQTNPTKAQIVNLALAGTPNAVLSAKELLAGYQKLEQTNPRLARNIDSVLGFASLAGDIATLGEASSLAKAGVKGVVNVAGDIAKGAGEAATKAGSSVASGVESVVSKGKGVVTKATARPEKSLADTIGEVVQGKTTDIEKAKKAFSSVDTTDVKSYTELGKKFEEKVPELAKVVDDELAKDVAEYTVKQLATKVPTKSGKAVVVNYVSNALKDLKELYKTIGDVAKQANIESMIKKGKFTRKEVNDISRAYNSEFGEKAFSKMGDPLTSVNAQRYSITRSGLKDVARQGIGGKAAKVADETMSSIYNTQRLIKRNIEAVNKLKQRIQERGLFEKIGHYATKYADILTGGAIRGAIAGLLPRGVGYKVLNALDLEESLAKNLKVIEKALKSKTDDEIISQAKSLDFPMKQSSKTTTPSGKQTTSKNVLNTTKAPILKTSDMSTSIPKSTNKSSGLLDTVKKALKDQRGSIEAYKESGNLTTKILKDLEGKTTVSKQYIQDLAGVDSKTGLVKEMLPVGIKKPEAELFAQILKDEGNTINISDFAKKVKQELLPLKSKVATQRTYDRTVLLDEMRGNVKGYKENLYESPIKTSAGENSHYPEAKNYFGHTRIEDMADNKTRRVIEVQSDLYQKGNLEKEGDISKLDNFEKAKLLPENKDYTEKYDAWKNTAMNRPTVNESTGRKSMPYTRQGQQRAIDIRKNIMDKILENYRKTPEYQNGLKQMQKGQAKLQQYNDPTAHFRMVREEIKKASQDGKTKLQFPTGETAMKIEGLSARDYWFHYGDSGDLPNTNLLKEDLKIGKEVINASNAGEPWIITDVLGDGKFKAIPKQNITSQTIKALQETGKMPVTAGYTPGAVEQFDISGKVDTNNPIYKFYEKDVQKYLNKFGGKRIVDDKGVSWIEIPITKEQGKAPVEAFGKIKLGLLPIGAGVGLGGAIIAGNIKKK